MDPHPLWTRGRQAMEATESREEMPRRFRDHQARERRGGQDRGTDAGEAFDKVDSGSSTLARSTSLTSRGAGCSPARPGAGGGGDRQILHRSVKTINTHRESIGKRHRRPRQAREYLNVPDCGGCGKRTGLSPELKLKSFPDRAFATAHTACTDILKLIY